MKTRNFFLLTAAFLMISLVPVQAQRGGQGRQQNQGQNTCTNLPDLTPEQQSKMQQLRTARLQETTAYRAQMNELRARKQSLQIAENPDMNQINAVIDQMAQLRTAQQKASAAHRQSIREILTPDQRALFDARAHKRPGMNQRGPGKRGAGRITN